MPNYAIVVAAGQGKRFGGYKQFYTVRGIPIIIYSLLHFNNNKTIDNIITVVPKNKQNYVKQLVREYELYKVSAVVNGGRRRQDSVKCGLDEITVRTGIVAIHDGARAIVKPRLISKGMRLCMKYRAVVFGTRVNDTMKQATAHRVKRTIPRNNIYLIQTPQFFSIQVLKRAYKNADLSVEYTDDAALCESCNIPVYLFQGDMFNVKITRKSDLAILEKLI
jgi:2-C-methyl-D-erythritol 4-phosphate cytidylyltransferase